MGQKARADRATSLRLHTDPQALPPGGFPELAGWEFLGCCFQLTGKSSR